MNVPITRIAHKTVWNSPILKIHFPLQLDSNFCYWRVGYLRTGPCQELLLFFSILSNHMRINSLCLLQDTK